MARVRASRVKDPGFILLTAVWLLLLAGAIAAAMMLVALRQGRQAVDAAAQLQAKLAVESAVQLIIADLLESGSRSPWARTPATGSIATGGAQVQVQVSAEAGRIDLNEADPALIASALQGLGVDPQARENVRAEIIRQRAAKRRFGHWVEMEQLLAAAKDTGDVCLASLFTFWSGFPSPSPQQMPDRLARALGQTGNMGQSGGVLDDVTTQVLRMEAPIGAKRVLAIVRITGWMDHPYEIYVWNSAGGPCSLS